MSSVQSDSIIGPSEGKGVTPSTNGQAKRPHKPVAPKVRFSHIPEELQGLPRWVVWRYVWRADKLRKDGSRERGDWDKPPFNARTGEPASTTDPKTWCSLAAAKDAYRRGGWDGIGIVLPDGIVGIDLDSCRDPQTGTIDPWAQEVIDEVKSYTENSPSSTGIRIVARGRIPGDRRRKGRFEIYDGKTKEGKPGGRYLTVTGQLVEGGWDSIRRCPNAIARVCERMFANEPGPKPEHPISGLTDDEIIAKAQAADNGAEFERLWRGELSDHPTHSEAVASLVFRLAFWTRDREQIDRLFRRSRQFHGKWVEKWKRSGQDEIDKALASVKESYKPRRPAAGRGAGREGYQFAPRTLAQLAEEVQPPEWLVEGLLVRGQTAVIGAPLKTMKTSLAADLAVSLATGTPFLGTFKVYRPIRVALLSGESGEWSTWDTIRRVFASRANRRGQPVNPARVDGLLVDFRLPQLGVEEDLGALARGLREHRVDVLILDPLYLALLSGTDLQASNLFDVGPLLARVTRACLDAGVTLILVHHTRKVIPVGQPIELTDLSFAGVAEFARQWLLLNRREKFDPDTGTHKLWLSAGGSCGQSGCWAVDVEEGRLDGDFGGRKWEVTVSSAAEQREAEKEAKASERMLQRLQEESADNAAVLAALAQLDPDRQGHGYHRVQVQAGLSDRKMTQAVLRLETRGEVEVVDGLPVEVGKGARRAVKGLRRLEGREPTGS